MRVPLVMPAYNEELLIGTCLEHALAQTPSFNEIIVIHNDSTDRTAAIAGEYARHNNQIRVVNEPTRTVANARRTGFDAATGDIICRVDADVRMSPGWAARSSIPSPSAAGPL